MSAINWLFGVSGNWSNGSKWSSGLAPTSSDDATIAVAGIYTVGVTNAAVAQSLTFNAASATLSEATTGKLTISGALDLAAGTVILHAPNSFGSVTETGGLLELFDSAALGSATLSMTGGEVTAGTSLAMDNVLSLGGAGVMIFDAVTGDTLHLNNGDWSLDATSAPTVQFGSAARKGTVVWRTDFAAIINGGSYTVDVAGGTLKAGDASFGFLLRNDGVTTIATGASIDLAGFSAEIKNLQGGGNIVDSGGSSAALVVNGGSFAGVISGAIGVEIAASALFTGVNTYTHGTTIDSGQELITEFRGSVAGAIVDNGFLVNLDSSGTFTTGVISGSGVVDQYGLGTLVLGHANSYSGGTNILAGKLLVGVGGALGTGAVTVANAELIGTATESLGNAMTFQGAPVIAASTGHTLTFAGASGMTWDASSGPLNITFGDATHAGTVVIGSAGLETVNFANPIHVRVADGTLKASGSALGFFFSFATDVKVSAGATLDLGGSGLTTPSLTSAGSIINSASTLVNLLTENTSSVSGVISGKLAVEVLNGALTLSGADSYTGGTKIDSGATLQLGTGGGTGSIVGNIDDEGALIVKESGSVSLAGVISGAGALTQSGAGATKLSGANTYSGGTTLLHGKLIVTNGKALGAGSVTLDDGAELISTTTMALAATQNGANNFTFDGATTIAAAHGTTLSIGGAQGVFGPGTMIFGEGANNGTIVYKVVGGTQNGAFTMRVNAGTLKAGDSVFGALTETANSVTVVTGATLDFAGFSGGFQNLAGAGAVTNSTSTLANVFDGAGSFGGVISGRIHLEVANVTLTGANTYTGGTQIDGGDTLQLGNGGATGSIVGAIDDEGALVVDESGTVSLAGVISGAGTFSQKGTGVTTLSAGNSYTGGTTIQHGELVSARSAALGNGGTITLTGGELLASASQTLSHDLTTTGTVTFAAATGTVLTLATATDTFNTGTLFFGDAAHTGTVVLKISSFPSTPDPTHTRVEVRDGVLKAGDSGLPVLLDSVAGTRIDTGATIDAAGQVLDVNSLTGAGALTNSGAATTLALFGATAFSGVLAGKWIEVEIFNTATLSGDETFTGTAVIEGGTVTLSGLFAEAVKFNGGGDLVLTSPGRFTGVVNGFASGSTVDLRNITTGSGAVLSYNTGTGVLMVTDGSHSAKLTFAGSYVLGNFAAASDGSGGTDISWQTPPPMAARPAPLAAAMAAFAAPAAAPAALGSAPMPPPRLLAAHAA